jgi:hypothetical protein
MRPAKKSKVESRESPARQVFELDELRLEIMSYASVHDVLLGSGAPWLSLLVFDQIVLE